MGLPLEGRRIQRRRGFVLAGVLVGLAMTLTACSSTSDIEQSLPEKNIDQWAMPLDAYRYVDGDREVYAQQLLIMPCMNEAGFDWPVPYQDPEANFGESFNSAERKIFNVDLASRFGYHTAPQSDSSADAWAAFTTFANGMSEPAQAQFNSCLKEANKTVQPLPLSAQLPASLVNSAIDSSLQENDVRDATAKWRSCMLPQGVSDLPETPNEMPTDSLIDRYNILPAEGEPATTAESGEIAVAVADAKCQESSGYRQAAYDAEWDHQATLLEDNADALTRIKGELSEYGTRLSDIISKNAPRS